MTACGFGAVVLQNGLGMVEEECHKIDWNRVSPQQLVAGQSIEASRVSPEGR